MKYQLRAARLLCLPMVLFCQSFSTAEDSATIAARMKSDLHFLASDELAGRDVGTEGIARAGEFVAERFHSLGLETDKFNGGPYQEFTIPGPTGLGAAEHNRLEFSGREDLPAILLSQNYSPLALGCNGSFENVEVAFVGFGISAPEFNYDDYANVDVSGKLVIVLRREPQQDDPNSRFAGRKNSQYAFFSSKELNAAVHKAAGLILVNDTQSATSQDVILGVEEAGSEISKSTVPTFSCSRKVIDELLTKAGSKSLEELQREIDGDAHPRSFILPGIKASGACETETKKLDARNVIGFLPGKGSLAEEFVVVGAHYDHVGMGGAGSLAPGTIEVHNGADDNASGTSGLLEVASECQKLRDINNRRGVIFIAFSSEEKGLLGSKYYIRNPRWPLENTVSMVNMDMIGRLGDNAVTIFGTGTAVGFNEMLDRLNYNQLRLDKQSPGFGPSDHQSFYEVGIPVFHFFTGLHNDYHRPSDDVEKLDINGIVQISHLVSDLVIELATVSSRPQALKNSAIAQLGNRKRATLGVRLFGENGPVVIRELFANGGAQKAGLMVGDQVLKIGEDKILEFRDLRESLSRHQPNEKVQVLIQRNGQQLSVEVELTP